MLQMLEQQEGQEAGHPLRPRRIAARTEWVPCWLTEVQQRMHSQYYTLMPFLEREKILAPSRDSLESLLTFVTIFCNAWLMTLPNKTPP